MTEHPLIDATIITQPLVSTGLAYKAATGLAMAGLGYIVSLQLQLDWGWSPLLASVAMLPQVVTLLLVGFIVEKFVDRFGIHTAAWFGSSSVLASLVIFAIWGTSNYIGVAISLVCVAAGLRIVGVVAGVNVMNGTPRNRTSIGAALVDTTDEITSGVSIAVVGTLIATVFVGNLSTDHWTVTQREQFHTASSLAAWILAIIAGFFVFWAMSRTRKVKSTSD